MANFIALCYATAKKAGKDTSKMSTDEVVEWYNKHQRNTQAKGKATELIKEYVSNGNKSDIEKGNLNVSSTNLEKDIDKILSGEYKDSHITLCERTPKILNDIGVPDKPFVMTSKHAYLVINENGKYKGVNDHYHGLGKELFINMPKLLESPIMVFKNHGSDNEIITVVNAIDKNKNPIIVPIKINATGSQNHVIVDVNLIKSIYGKNNIQAYIDNNVKEEDMLLIENKKIRNLNSK